MLSAATHLVLRPAFHGTRRDASRRSEGHAVPLDLETGARVGHAVQRVARVRTGTDGHRRAMAVRVCPQPVLHPLMRESWSTSARVRRPHGWGACAALYLRVPSKSPGIDDAVGSLRRQRSPKPLSARLTG